MDSVRPAGGCGKIWDGGVDLSSQRELSVEEKNDNLDELAEACQKILNTNTRTNWMNCTGWAVQAEVRAKNHDADSGRGLAD